MIPLKWIFTMPINPDSKNSLFMNHVNFMSNLNIRVRV